MRRSVAGLLLFIVFLAASPSDAFASKACDWARLIMRSSFGVDFVPRTQAEKASLWDRVAARPDVQCHEPNPYRSSEIDPDPESVTRPSQPQKKGSNPTGAAIECLATNARGSMDNKCNRRVRLVYWNNSDCRTGCLDEIGPGGHSTVAKSPDVLGMKACFDYCSFESIGFGSPMAKEKVAVSPSKKSKVATEKPTSNSGGYDIDPKTGKACVEMHPVESKNMRGINGNFVSHHYKIKNFCKKNFDLKITTLAGWTSYSAVRAGGTAKWFCTDGYKGNKDCGGGVGSYTFR